MRSSFRDTGYSPKNVTCQMFDEKRSWIIKTFGIAAIENHVNVSTHRSLGGIISYDYDSKQQKFTNPSEPPNRLISNGTAECKTAHRVAVLSSAEETSELVFTDVGAKKVECLLLGEDVLTVEVSD